MRQVRECDFCGEGASGVYEPVPSSLDPDGPRLLLCEGCHDRLRTVVEPLLDHIDNGAPANGLDTDGTAENRAEGVVADSSAGMAAPADGTTDELAADTAADGDTDADGGVVRDNETPGADGSGAATSGGVDAGGRSDDEREGTPKGYRKVMRFLENRSFPMGREEAEHLAAEAYNLDESATSAAIDHAVKYGRLREVHGKLKR